MLQFFKKSGRGTSTDEKTQPSSTLSQPPPPYNKTNKRHSMPSTTIFQQNDDDDNYLDDNLDDDAEDKIIESRSRLSMNLTEIVSDKNCLSYLIQFLETKNALSLIKFYLDAECFRTATERLYSTEILNDNSNMIKNCQKTKITTLTPKINVRARQISKSTSSECSDKLSLNSSFDVSSASDLMSIDSQTNDTTITQPLTNNHVNIEIVTTSDDLQTNNDHFQIVPELKTLCDLSMRKSIISNDATKSLICSEKTTQNSQKQLEQQLPPNSVVYENHCNEKHNNNNNNNNNNNSSHKFKHSTNSLIATDAIRIYRKYLNSNSQYFIDIPATILSIISLELCKYEIDDFGNEIIELISSKCFNEAQQYVFERLEMDYLSEFLESSYYCKYCVEILTNTNNLMLSDILHNESALFYFMEYLEQENQHNLLEFWIAAMNFRKHYLTKIAEDNSNNKNSSLNQLQAQTDAMILYEKYFSLQAPTRLKISKKIRSQIEECICSADGDHQFIGKCFDYPLIVIEKYIEKYQFVNFLNCQLFANYLNDLKTKTQDHYKWRKTSIESIKSLKNNQNILSDNLTNKNKNKNNKNFISEHNTLLAMENQNTKYKKTHKFNNNCTNYNNNTSIGCNNMQIDLRQLNDPDLLWQRAIMTDRLTFGRVNALGRYERDFDIDTINATAATPTITPTTPNSDDKWSLLSGSNKIKNAVRKFVNLPEDKVQEEIAWQVAEMIVKDITSITLANDNTNTATTTAPAQ